jgi:hypothetical protein
VTNEDRVAAKLKGYNCFIKSNDGEVLLLEIQDLDDYWFHSVDGVMSGDDNTFPAPGISIRRESIKYVCAI